jgi:hypothetical protein
MYLARKQIYGKTHYCIRESYKDGDLIKSRDLIELGTRPDKYIIYPGGNACYFHEDVYDQLSEKGVHPDDDELEKIFWPFLKHETRRVIEGFTHRGRSGKKHASLKEACRRCETETFHMFDIRRIHYLRFAQLDQSKIFRAPKKIYRSLLDKSRDEIEQQFLQMENVLDANEKKSYTYVVFNVPDHFSGTLARNYPHALSQKKVDDCFVEEVCRLHSDESFWAGMSRSGILHEHLVRYVCWFFDHDYAESRYLDQLVYDWMARRRDFNPPKPEHSMGLTEALSVLGLTQKELSGLTVKSLTRHYRQMARKLHPDTGGGHNRFIKLSQAFEDLLRKVRSKGKPGVYRTRRGAS